MARPERLVVGHPFNPVYLLPLVEVCGGERTGAGDVRAGGGGLPRRSACSRSLVRHEIDGFIADRLLEALWREALWLVARRRRDGRGDRRRDPLRRRACAGRSWATFLTYRIAGGEAGMRHFMAQFGPALQWPWTQADGRARADRRAARQDRRAVRRRRRRAARSRELERLRDDCLVAVLQALRGSEAPAPARRSRDWERGCSREPARTVGRRDVGEPLALRATVLPDWIDYNGHVHESRYLQVFGDATDALLAAARDRRGIPRRRRQLLHRRDAPLASPARLAPAIGCR